MLSTRIPSSKGTKTSYPNVSGTLYDNCEENRTQPLTDQFILVNIFPFFFLFPFLQLETYLGPYRTFTMKPCPKYFYASEKDPNVGCYKTD